MKKFFAALVIALSMITLSLDASAARLGGGASFGRSMSIPRATPSVPKAIQRPSTTQRPQAAAAGAAAASKSMGMGTRLLIGAATALGFMALANALGLGEGFAQILMFLAVGMVLLYVFRLFMARKTAPNPSMQRSGERTNYTTLEQDSPVMRERVDTAPSMNEVRRGSAMDQFAQGGTASESTFDVPADFDKENFLNMSSAYFKMLQKAWDSGDLDSLDNYTTSEVFTQLTHQRREIKGQNVTEVINLKAELAGFETTPSHYVASVKFSGRLRENGDEVDIEEIWNLIKPRDEEKTGWLLAGIEQVA